MAWIRPLPSRLWAATVRLPTGRRRTSTHELRGVVADWAADLEADIRCGDWIDPAAGKVTVAELWDRFAGARRLELASRRRDESHWRCHVEPEWGRTPVGGILRPDVRAWVEEMRRRKVGAATIQGALGVLRAVLDLAVDARMVRLNAAAGVKGPPRPAHLDRVLAEDEEQPLLAALDRVAPGRPDARLLAELMLYCGLRWEEACAIRRERVQLRNGILDIGPVLERDRTIREYPKSPAGQRQVPVPDHVWPRVRARAMATAPGGVLVVGPRGGLLDYSRWHDRVWQAALYGVAASPRVRGHARREAIAGASLADPQPTPHDLRHTYGTRLAEDGVPPHEIMALIGHSSLQAVQRYLHPGEGRFARWRLDRKTGRTLADLARWINPIVRGWMQYYGRFNRSALHRSCNASTPT